MSTPTDERDEQGFDFLSGVVLFQVLLLTAMITLPFGFDKRSWLGLDFEHLLVLMGLFALAWLYALVVALAFRRWWVVAFQLGVAAIIAFAFFLMFEGYPPFQHPKPTGYEDIYRASPAAQSASP